MNKEIIRKASYNHPLKNIGTVKNLICSFSKFTPIYIFRHLKSFLIPDYIDGCLRICLKGFTDYFAYYDPFYKSEETKQMHKKPILHRTFFHLIFPTVVDNVNYVTIKNIMLTL